MNEEQSLLVQKNEGGYVANQQYFNSILKPPPEGHRNAIRCTECGGLTWRNTPICVHCGYEIRKNLYIKKIEIKLRIIQSRIDKLGLIMLTGTAILLIVGTLFDIKFMFFTVIIFLFVLMLMFNALTDLKKKLKKQLCELRADLI